MADLPNPTNRGFIEAALEDATAVLAGDPALTVEPVVDRDTKGIPGAPDIATTIFDKIDKASVFVGDVSIVHPPRSKGRRSPNPNVLLELGTPRSRWVGTGSYWCRIPRTEGPSTFHLTSGRERYSSTGSRHQMIRTETNRSAF
jgi:hypothetical protein